MDKNVSSSGFDEAKLGAVGAMLEGAVAAGDLSGVVALVWRKGEVVRGEDRTVTCDPGEGDPGRDDYAVLSDDLIKDLSIGVM